MDRVGGLMPDQQFLCQQGGKDLRAPLAILGLVKSFVCFPAESEVTATCPSTQSPIRRESVADQDQSRCLCKPYCAFLYSDNCGVTCFACARRTSWRSPEVGAVEQSTTLSANVEKGICAHGCGECCLVLGRFRRRRKCQARVGK